MEKEEIVNFFLKEGFAIDAEGLEYFYRNQEKIDPFLQKLRQTKESPVTIDLKVIRKILEETFVEIEEFKKPIAAKETVSVNEVTEVLIRRYKKIRSFFSNRIDLVNPISVNRITEKTKRFSLVVMVSEKNVVDKSLKVEDLTGWTTVYVDDNFFDSIVMDEIIGAVCERRDDQIKVTNVLWPDTPLRREISILDEDLCCLFLSDLLLNQNLEQKTETILKRLKGMKYEQLFIFLFGEPFDKERIEKFLSKMPTNSKVFLVQDQTNFEDVDGISCLISPAFLRIGRKINLLLCSGKQFSSYKRIWPNKAPEEIMLNLLRKRHLDPVFDLGKVSDEDRLTIDPVPDIFVSGSFGPPGITNYKGTTIISCGSFPSEPIYWIVNLRTRENIKISLA